MTDLVAALAAAGYVHPNCAAIDRRSWWWYVTPARRSQPAGWVWSERRPHDAHGGDEVIGPYSSADDFGDSPDEPSILPPGVGTPPPARRCSAAATEERTIEGVVCPLCSEHAAEIDRDAT